MRKVREISLISWVALLAFALFAVHASAETYPSNACASEKMKAAANRCDQVLKAWSRSVKTRKDPLKRIAKADRTFDSKWASAEDNAAKENVDCADMTLSSAGMKTLMDTAIDDIVAEVSDGLDVGVKKDVICGGKLLKSAATMCQKLLKAESRLIDDLSSDPDRAKCDRKQAKAGSQFSHQWGKTTRKACPTTATDGEIADMVAALSDDVVTNTTVSPNVPNDVFMAISHPVVGAPGHEVVYEGDALGPRCQDSSQYSFFARRGTENKLLMYYEGGGACWDGATCGLELCKQDVNLDKYTPLTAGGGDFGGGFADLTNPDNPFKDWHVVYVPYCSCDVHWGDAANDYPETVIIPGAFSFPERHYQVLQHNFARQHGKGFF